MVTEKHHKQYANDYSHTPSSGCFAFSLQDLRHPPKPLHDPAGNLLAVMWHATARAPALVLSRAGDGGVAGGSVTLAIVKRDPNSRTLSPQRAERKLCFLWLAGGVSGPWALHGWANAIRHTAGTSVCRNLVSLYMTNAPHTEAPGCDCGGQQLYILLHGAPGLGHRVASVIGSTPGQFIWFDTRCAGPIFTGAPVVEVALHFCQRWPRPTKAMVVQDDHRRRRWKGSLMLDLNQLSL
ncbi:unnamed protein product [Arctogadus glacialis]